MGIILNQIWTIFDLERFERYWLDLRKQQKNPKFKLFSTIWMVLMCDEETRYTKKTNNDGVIMTHNYTPKSNTYTQTWDRASKR